MATYGSKPPRYGSVSSALAGGPASAYGAQMPKAPSGALAGGPASFFGSDPFGLARGGQVTVAPAIKPASQPTPYRPPAGPAGPQQNPQAVAPPPDTTAPMPAYDYNTDPILQQIAALSTQKRGDAESGALSLRKQLAIDYGDTDYARSVLGDENTAQAAAGNPNSVRAQLLRSYQTGQGSLDENLNKANLFYGGERVKQQGQLTQNYQGQLADAAGREQQALGGIQSSLLAALSGADQADMQGQQDAAARALQASLLAAMMGGGGGGGGVAEPAPVPPASSLNLGYQVLGVPFGASQPPRPAPQTRLRSKPLAQLL